MARIRTIKPEFPQSESMGNVSRDARLLFVMLWTICDDSGRTRGNSRMLASLLFPYDDDAPALLDGWLAELERECCVVRYQADGASYLQVCNWLNHQKIDKPSQSKIPAFDERSRILANPREPSPLDQGPRTKDQGEEGNGLAPASPSQPATRKTSGTPNRGKQLPDDFLPDETCHLLATQLGAVVAVEFPKFSDYHRAKGSTMKDWQAAFRTWLNNSVKFGRPAAGVRHQNLSERREATISALTGRTLPVQPQLNAIEGASHRVA